MKNIFNEVDYFDFYGDYINHHVLGRSCNYLNMILPEFDTILRNLQLNIKLEIV